MSINPSATIVDISHQIDRQDIGQAALAIHSGYQYFPDGTVHAIVVDPGVGTARRLLALRLKGHCFVAPDNGVLTLLLGEGHISSLNLITNAKYFRYPVSSTFHGRDIIGPVAAHLTCGLPANELGPEIQVQNIIRLDNLLARCTDDGELIGEVAAIDHFGNLITNIRSDTLSECLEVGAPEEIRVNINSSVIKGLSETYAGKGSNTALALIGSRGYLEIAVNKGHAAQLLNAQKGDHVRVAVERFLKS